MGFRYRKTALVLLAFTLTLLPACASRPPSQATAVATEAAVTAAGAATTTAAVTVMPTVTPTLNGPATTTATMIEATLPTQTSVPSPAPAVSKLTPDETQAAPAGIERATAVTGVIDVRDGFMLERDIVPQLARVFALSPVQVRKALASGRSSRLISEKAADFRRMEGVIPPGHYAIPSGRRIEDQIETWITLAEARYDRLVRDARAAGSINRLAPAQQLILASMVEAECLADQREREVATVFLNRLDQNGLLQSCVTVEYAVGYQRPYLLKTDLKTVSAYNTYLTAGLPPGPICSPDDTSLRAAISRKLDSAIHYFYYDYLLNDLFCFVTYSDFSREAARSKERFVAGSAIGRWDKINKQKLYGR